MIDYADRERRAFMHGTLKARLSLRLPKYTPRYPYREARLRLACERGYRTEIEAAARRSAEGVKNARR